MDKQYRYRAAITQHSHGYEGEEIGPPPGTTPWITTSAMSGSNTDTYYFRDSNANPPTNADSSKVSITVTDSWTVSIDAHNVMTVTVDTTVVEIYRGDINGNPNAYYSTKRDLFLRRSLSSANLYEWRGLDIATVGVISHEINFPSYTFTLQPGESASQNTLYVINCTPGHDNDPLPSWYVDAFGVGVEFENILPADYRPGQTWNGSNWMSHNRVAGAANIYTSATATQEMRTLGGPTESNDPPTIQTGSRWANQQLIGTGA